MKEDEWKLAARRAMASSVLHVLVCPHSPERGALLSSSGKPVLTDYTQVDWRGLARTARAVIEKDVPKSVGVYIGDDAIDVMDVLHISTKTGMPFKDEPSFESRARSILSNLTMKDMRSGITKISGCTPNIHINTPINGKRPPLGALIVSIKITRATQIIDYLTGASMNLFGAPVVVGTFQGYSPEPTTGKMPVFLREWLESQFGVVYGENCTVMVVERTFSI